MITAISLVARVLARKRFCVFRCFGTLWSWYDRHAGLPVAAIRWVATLKNAGPAREGPVSPELVIRLLPRSRSTADAIRCGRSNFILAIAAYGCGVGR